MHVRQGPGLYEDEDEGIDRAHHTQSFSTPHTRAVAVWACPRQHTNWCRPCAGAALQVIPAHTNGVFSCKLSPSGSAVLTGGQGDLKLWDTQYGGELLALKGQHDRLNACYFLDAHGECHAHACMHASPAAGL